MNIARLPPWRFLPQQHMRELLTSHQHNRACYQTFQYHQSDGRIIISVNSVLLFFNYEWNQAFKIWLRTFFYYEWNWAFKICLRTICISFSVNYMYKVFPPFLIGLVISISWLAGTYNREISTLWYEFQIFSKLLLLFGFRL